MAPPSSVRVLELMRAIWALDHALHRTSKRMAATLGVTGPQRLALRLLARRSAGTAGELAQLMHLHPSTVTGVLARLEENGFVRRTVDRRDRRRAHLTLTARGRKLSRQSAGTIEGAVATALAGSSGRDQAATVRVLVAVAQALARATRTPHRQ